MSLDSIILTDAASGASASILPGLGFNCYAFRTVWKGRQVPVLWSEPEFARGDKRASASGNPILFPYPGRIRGQSLTWEGRVYPLEGDDHRGNAIHGFVLTRPWRVVEATPQRARGQFQASQDAPELLERWPADFRITAEYALAENTLHAVYRVENPDSRPLPCGLGLHPYFAVPVGGSSAEQCRVELPVTRRWELADMLPTGRMLPVEDAGAYRSGLLLGDLRFDDVFTGLEYESRGCVCAIRDPASGLRVELQFDRAFRECVVYNPPHREAVCIEPYTCVPNAWALKHAGADSGLRILPAGAAWEARLSIRLLAERPPA